MRARATLWGRVSALAAGLFLAAAGAPGAAAQDKEKDAPGPAQELRGRLRKLCAEDGALHGVLVTDVEADKDGKRLLLHGLVDRKEQAALLKKKADVILLKEVAGSEKFFNGVVVDTLQVFPIRSEYLGLFQRDFAGDWDGEIDRHVLPRTRIDDVYYNPEGNLFLVGVSLARPAPAEKGAKAEPDPRAVIADAMARLLGRHGLRLKAQAAGGKPVNLIPNAGGIVFAAEDPVAELQRRAPGLGLDDVAIQAARYDATGALRFIGFVARDRRADVLKKLDEFFAGTLAAKLTAARILRPAGKGEEPRWSFEGLRSVAWGVSPAPLQQQLAASTERLARATRLDRTYYRPDGKGGLELYLEGVCCDGTLAAGPQAGKVLKNALAAACVRAAPALTAALGKEIDHKGIVAVAPPLRLQKAVAADPKLDGVRLDDGASFDAAGRLRLVGVWRGERQAVELRALVAEGYKAETKRPDARGVSFADMREVDTGKLLTALRQWAAKHLEEVWVERLHFDAEGRARFEGMRPEAVPLSLLPWLDGAPSPAEAALTQQLRRLIEAHPQYELLEIKGGPAQAPAMPQVSPEAKKAALAVLLTVALQVEEIPDPLAQLKPRPSLTRKLRQEVQGTARVEWAGVLIERGYYDVDGVYTVQGLVDRPEQTAALRRRLDELYEDAQWRPLFLGQKARVELTVLPLAPLLRALREVMPDYPELDGMRPVGAYHDVENRLVLTGYEVPGLAGAGAAELLAKLLGDDALWGRRAAAGFQLALTPIERQVLTADLAVQRSVDLVRKSLPDALGIGCVDGMMPLVPPYNRESKRLQGSLPADVSEATLKALAAALMHNPTDDTAAWFLRALVHMAGGERQLAARDLRRLTLLEADRPYLREGRMMKLELLQGELRTVVADFADHAAVEASSGRARLRLADVRRSSR